LQILSSLQKWFFRATLILVVLTIGLFAWYNYGMNNSFVLDADSDFKMDTVDDRPMGGASVASFSHSSDGITLNCELKDKYQWPFCEIYMVFKKAPEGIDFTKYTHLSLNISIEGPGDNAIRIYLRHFDNSYSIVDDTQTYKVNEFSYNPNDEDKPYLIPLTAFKVANWWVNENKIDPQRASRDLTNVSYIELSTGGTTPNGFHTIKIHDLTFVGKKITETTFYLIIIFGWFSMAILYLLVYVISTRRAIAEFQLRERKISQINIALELEKRELKELAHQDFLTNTYNRLGLRNHIYELTSNAQRHKTDFSIIFMDLDKFKLINDKFGHDVGDEILIAFADLVRENTRSDDVFGRWGGEEFILLCPHTSLEEAQQVAEKIRKRIVDMGWTKDVKLSCSFGIAKLMKNENITELFKRADSALYSSKKMGRNRVTVSSRR